MRPFPWIARVGLFAVGFGAGLSHYRAPSTQLQPVSIEIRLANTDVMPAVSEANVVASESPCPIAAPNLEILSARS